jgi:bla regulator protein BlaR1
MIALLTTHLWQSTFFAIAAALLTLAFRRNRAGVRYWLWLSASLKFLVPFAFLTSLGAYLESSMPAARQVATQIVAFYPIQENLPSRPPAPDTFHWIPLAFLAVWLCGFATIALIRFRSWLPIRNAIRTSTLLRHSSPALEIRISPGLLEPGVVGLLRPTLFLPDGIAERLTSSQLEAVLAHEFCHIRRRDNLFAALHMIVEAIFWFHPLVWWIGARLVEERERACDEEVVRLGNAADVYADAILNVCKLYTESPLACVSGVTGAGIRQRIEAIMSNQRLEGLNLAKKILLASAGVATLTGPVVVGLIIGVAHIPAIHAQQATPTPPVTQAAPVPAVQAAPVKTAPALSQTDQTSPPKFEVTSVRLNKSPDLSKALLQFLPGGRFVATNIPLMRVIAVAWSLPLQSQRLTLASGVRMPDDISYIEATAEKGTLPPGLTPMERFSRMKLMLQALLEDRFKLRIRPELQEQPVYALVVAKGGPKLEKSKFQEQDCGDAGPNWLSNPACHFQSGGQGRGLHGASITIAQVVENVQNSTDRPLFDKTGLTGYYDIQTEGWAPMRVNPASLDGAPQSGDASVNSPDRPTLFDVFEKLGLQMESQRAVIEMFVIDHVERPNEN